MRMSCHGCRVLRKGCSNVCTIRPCLQWITSPEAQANATLFLAKFYGRAGLINLINAGPPHLRPAIFRSLLYEACGRIINPVYGSVGFLWSGSWRLCQAAVESVLLRGEPTAHFPTSDATGPKIYDIRHVTKTKADGAVAGCDLHNVAGSSRGRFKRIGNATKPHSSPGSDPFGEIRPDAEERSERENSVGAPKGSSMSQGDPEGRAQEDEGDAELELTLGFEPATRVGARGRGPVIRPDAEGIARSAVGCPVDLGLSLC